MKKRKLFLGVLLASAIFGMAACNNASSTDDDADKQSDTSGNTDQGDSGDQGGSGDTTKESYTVTFNTNGGSTVANQTVEEGSKATKPANPTKDADSENTYTFAGWFKEAACTTAFDFNTSITADTIIYAKWDATPISTDLELLDLNINYSAVVQEVQIGNKISLDGLVVTGFTMDAETVTLTADQYTVTVKDPSNAAFDIANDTTTAGTYTVVVSTDLIAKTRSFNIVVKAEQFKYDIPFSADSYNASLETPYEGNATITAGTYTFLDNRSITINYVCTNTNGKLQTTDSNGNSVAKSYEGVTYNSRFQVNDASKACFNITPKVSGKMEFLYSTDVGRYIVAKEGANVISAEAVTAETKEDLHSFILEVEAEKTYQVYSSTKGSNIYAMCFHASVDKSSVIATDYIELNPTAVEFDTTTNKFNASAPGVTVTAYDNYDNPKAIALSECTVVVKDSSDAVVTGEITTAGTYTVSITYDGKTETYTVSVADLSAPITAVALNTDEVATEFYDVTSATLNTEGLIVTGTKGGVDITLEAADYTVELYNAGTKVDGFTTAGAYTVRIVSTEDTTIYAEYEVAYYSFSSLTLTPVYEKDTDNNYVTEIQTGSTKFIHNARLTGVYTDTAGTTVKLDDYINANFYSDAAMGTDSQFATAEAAFASAGTVYCKLSYRTAEVTVIITVKDLTTYTWKAEYINPLGNADKAAVADGTELDNNFTLVGKNATMRVNSAGTKVNSIELGKELASAIMFTLTADATVSFVANSTSGTNTTAGFGFYTDMTAKTLATGTTATDVVGNGVTVSADLTAGTYYIGHTETGRGGQVVSITVTYK